MRKYNISFFLAITLFFIFQVKMQAQKVSSYDSKWNPELAFPDDESLFNIMQYDDKSTFMFLISNNEEQLFIELFTSDQATIQKIMRYGLTTWLNSEGKTRKGTGIGFPVAPAENGDHSFRKDKGGDRKAMMMAMMEMKNGEMELIGFDGKGSSKIIDPRKDPQFDGKLEMKEGGKLHISLEIPLSKLGRGKEAANFSPVSLGFETGYMDVTGQGGSAGGGPTSDGGGHGGGMYGGGPGGGPPMGGGQGEQPGGGQQQPDISKLAAPSKLWIKQLVLAEKL
jgi:hypothetical protein